MAFRIALPLCIAALVFAGSAQAAGLTEAAVREFAGRQETAWNARDLAAFYGLFTADAVFADQARTPKGELIPYGKSDLAKAREQTKKFLAGATSVERGVVGKVTIAADGRSAQVTASQVSTIKTATRTRVVCAERAQTVVLSGGTIRSRGLTDTLMRCPR